MRVSKVSPGICVCFIGLFVLAGSLFGDGFDGFEDPVTYQSGSLPRGLATADITGDGSLDLVVVNSGNATLSILQGLGDGTFALAGSIATHPDADNIALGDFNGDSLPDAAVLGDSPLHEVAVHLNQGNGQLGPAIFHAIGGNARSVALGDMDGDNNLDIVVGVITPAAISILFGNGDGTFQAFQQTPLVLSAWTVAVEDLDNDGNQDVVAACLDTVPPADPHEICVLRNDGAGNFLAPIRQEVFDSPVSLAFGDFNGDLVSDVAVANRSGFATVLISDGFGGFVSREEVFLNGKPNGIATADFDNNGHADIVVVDEYLNRANILIGNGSGSFTDPLRYATGTNPINVVAGDFDEDGHIDIAASNFFSPLNTAAVLINATGNSVCAELESVEIVIGRLISGGVEDLDETDDQRLMVQSGFNDIFADVSRNEIEIAATTSLENPEFVRVTTEASVTEQGGLAEVRAWNYLTSEYDFVHIHILSPTDRIERFPTLLASSYVSPKGEINIRIRYIVFNPSISPHFISRFDQIQIAVE